MSIDKLLQGGTPVIAFNDIIVLSFNESDRGRP